MPNASIILICIVGVATATWARTYYVLKTKEQRNKAEYKRVLEAVQPVRSLLQNGNALFSWQGKFEAYRFVMAYDSLPVSIKLSLPHYVYDIDVEKRIIKFKVMPSKFRCFITKIEKDKVFAEYIYEDGKKEVEFETTFFYFSSIKTISIGDSFDLEFKESDSLNVYMHNYSKD